MTNSDILILLCFSLACQRVQESVKIAIETQHDSFFGSKKHDCFWNAFDSMYVVGHVKFSIQVQQSSLGEVMRILDWPLIACQI